MNAIDSPMPRVIRVMCDYEALLPLWGEGGNLSDKGLWLSMGVSEELLADLEQWQLDWGIDPNTEAWESSEAGLKHAAEGERLQARLQQELPAYRVELTLP